MCLSTWNEIPNKEMECLKISVQPSIDTWSHVILALCDFRGRTFQLHANGMISKFVVSVSQEQFFYAKFPLELGRSFAVIEATSRGTYVITKNPMASLNRLVSGFSKSNKSHIHTEWAVESGLPLLSPSDLPLLHFFGLKILSTSFRTEEFDLNRNGKLNFPALSVDFGEAYSVILCSLILSLFF